MPHPTHEHHGRDVTLLALRFWPDMYGGLEKKMWSIAQTLAASHHRVHVLTEDQLGHEPHPPPPPGMTIERIPLLDCGRLWRWRYLLRLRWWCQAIKRYAKRGTIWANDPMMALAVIAAGRRQDLIYQPIACFDALNDLIGAYPQAAAKPIARSLRWTDRLAYNLALFVIFESHNARDQFERCYGKRPRIHVQINAPFASEIPDESARFANRANARRHWGLSDRHWVVGFVGRLDYCKDVGFLLRALAQQPLEPNVRVLIVGDGPDRAQLERQADRAGLANRITWTNRVDNPAQAYAAMDAMVLPSVYEVFGNVILEAMAAGVPVIGRQRDTDPHRPVLNANQELIQDGQTGLLVDPHDPNDLAVKLRILMMFPGARQAMARNAQQFARRLSWQQIVDQYWQIYHNPSQAQPEKQAA